MKKIITVLMLTLLFSSLWAGKKVSFCSKKYKLIEFFKGKEIKKCSKEIITNPITDLSLKEISIDSLLTKNKYTLVIMATSYGIGCGTSIGAREALLKKLSQKFPGKIFEILEYWNNDLMNDTVSKLVMKKMHTCSFEIIDGIPIYLDYGAKNIAPITSDLHKRFLHSAWIILDNKNHIHFIMEEIQTSRVRNYDRIYKIIEKYLLQ